MYNTMVTDLQDPDNTTALDQCPRCGLDFQTALETGLDDLVSKCYRYHLEVESAPDRPTVSIHRKQEDTDGRGV